MKCESLVNEYLYTRNHANSNRESKKKRLKRLRNEIKIHLPFETDMNRYNQRVDSLDCNLSTSQPLDAE